MTTTGSGQLQEVERSRDLTPLFSPKSLAIVGASDDPGKFGFSLTRGALRGEHRRSVYLVNQGSSTVAGRPTYRSLGDLDVVPELAVLAAPAAAVSSVVDEALALGTRAFIGITAGIPEDVELDIAARIRAAGAVLVGPNCIGVADASTDLDLFAWGWFDPGSVAILSQSGALAMDIGRGVSDAGIGVSRVVSMGNCADLQPADFIRDLAKHDETKVIAIYLEGVGDGRDFLRAAAEARLHGKAVVALAAEPTEATVRAAKTHTRSLLSDGRVLNAAYNAAGIVQVHSVTELVRAVRVLAAPRRPVGRRVGIVSEGGGPGIIASDAMARAGLEVPEFSPALQERLGAVVHAMGTAANPVDIGFGGTVAAICAAAETMIESDEIDAVLLTGAWSTSDFFIEETTRERDADFRGLGALPEGKALELSRVMAGRDQEAARSFVAATARHGVPAYGAFFNPTQPSARILEDGGSPVFRSADEVARAIALSIPVTEDRPPIPAVPEADLELGADDYFTTRAFLSEAGMEFARALQVHSVEEAQAAARELGFPVVLKALASMHKSDGGGVVLGLETEDEVAEAFRGMEPLGATDYSVEEMVTAGDAVELILGARVDDQFGPIVLVGMGGIYSELLDDTAVELAPVDVDGAEAMIRRLRGAMILAGMRGRPPLDVRAAAEQLSALSHAISRAPNVLEIEVNPLLVSTDRALGVDASAVI